MSVPVSFLIQLAMKNDYFVLYLNIQYLLMI